MSFDDPFFKDFHKEAAQMHKGLFKSFGLMALLTLAVNFAFFGGLIYFGFWCLQHFGVI